MAFNLFTWWTGSTFGTWLDTRSAREVGRDADGNVYYAAKNDSRRFVIYATDTDASRVPPEWHLWLHRTRREPPNDVPLPVRAWERPWRPNPTGTAAAERPKGAIGSSTTRAAATGDYRAWSPDEHQG
jgi:NADH:ubiquinone oxidoreductase subunit